MKSSRPSTGRNARPGRDDRLHGELEIEAVIDTGFSDFITLPPAVTIALDLNLHPMALLEVIESGEEAR